MVASKMKETGQNMEADANKTTLGMTLGQLSDKRTRVEKGDKMSQENNKSDSIINVERKNEALMQEGVVSEEEFKCFSGMGPLYGEKVMKTAQQIARMLNGFTIEEANRTLDMARYGLKYTAVIKL